ncbi:MAG: hypothetical protein ABJE47_18220 [bacterium]
MNRRSAFRRTLLIAGLLGGATSAVGAQRMSARRIGPDRMAIPDERARVALASSADSNTSWGGTDRIPEWTAPIASAVVPGLGQLRLHQDRFLAYMLVEGVIAIEFFRNQGERNTRTAEYKDLARTVARRDFVATPGATPRDTLWKYYEGMRNYRESGAFTLASAGPIVPETDTATFNGHQWLLARRQFGLSTTDPASPTSPSYASALAFYESRAVHHEFGWSWRDAPLEWDVYKSTTERANNAERQVTNDIIAIIANHVLSSIDAFATVRLRQAPGGGMRLSAAIETP